MKKILSVTLLFVAAIVTFEACSKDNNYNGGGSSKLSVYLTDDPGSYDAVYIDIEEIQVKAGSDSSEDGWQSLPLTKKGIYNLLDFRNGLDTLLTSADLPAGTISQIRLVLGSNNSVIVNGIEQPLTTPSAQQSGLKLNIHATLQAGIEYRLWIDFDAARSIVHTGSDKYILKPVIRTYTEATSGSVKGIILPPGAHAWIYALNNSDTIGSASQDILTGAFRINGLNAGSYSIAIDADSTSIYKDSVITNVNVNVGQVSDIGSITLHP